MRVIVLMEFDLFEFSALVTMAIGLVRFLVLLLAVAICGAASVVQPISDSHRSAAQDVFVPVDGSYKRLVSLKIHTLISFLECCGVHFGFRFFFLPTCLCLGCSLKLRNCFMYSTFCTDPSKFEILLMISLEEAYEALKTLEILEIDKKSDLSSATCENVVKVLGSSSSSTLKDAFYALKVNGILKCKTGEDVPKVNNCLLSVRQRYSMT